MFLLPTPRNNQKRDKQIEKSGFEKKSIFCKSFSTRLFCKTFFVCPRQISTWTFCKNVFVVFLNSPYRETPKNVLKTKKQGEKSRLVGGSEI
jgi:hypothetical protein